MAIAFHVADGYYRRMTLTELYRIDGPIGLRKLALACGVGEKYLYQCATGRRVLSPELAKGLVSADARLTLDELYAAVEPKRANEEAA